MTIKQRIGRWVMDHSPVTRFLFDLNRTELNVWLVAMQNRLLPSRARALNRLRRQKEVYANVACGPLALDGFVNLDLYPCADGVLRYDCRSGVPLGNDSGAGIRVEHFFEHLEPRQEVPAFLRDCRRALRPGRVLCIVVPDAGEFSRAYATGTPDAFSRLGFPQPFPDDLPTRMDIVNHVFHQWHEHRWGYDEESLAARLHEAGFSKVQRMSFGKSLDPRLAQDAPHHRPYSLYMDAVK